MQRLVLLFAFAAVAASAPLPGLQAIIDRGFLKCGLYDSESSFGRAVGRPQPEGNTGILTGWAKGFDAEFCKAFATGLFGSPGKNLKYSFWSGNDRFTALTSGQIDVQTATSTATITRDVELGVTFTRPIFYDGQGIVVLDRSITEADFASGKASYCVRDETTSAGNIAALFPDAEAVIVAEDADFIGLIQNGTCDAFTSDKSELVGLGLDAGVDFKVLDITLSREPLAASAADDNNDVAEYIRWVVNGLVIAELYGINKFNVNDKIADPSNLPGEAKQLLGIDFENPFGLPADFMAKVIARVGNYGQIYRRTIGDTIPRGPNNLYTKGGLQFPESWN